MKKVININFQGRVIPIEENAYDTLKNYVESLRRFFANEEGRDEIINDIEGRIAELFGETLKKGSTCISEEDVEKIVASMGRPEDFDDDEAKLQSKLNEGANQHQQYTHQQNTEIPRGRLYRDENDKILGGVCSGIAAYLRVDPTFVRLVFALLLFGAGTGFLLYMIMWIILPKKNLDHTLTNTKKLYRNPDEKVIAGVASGLAAYFNIAVWIPRLIFALPLISTIFSSAFRHVFWLSGSSFPRFMFGSFTGTLTLVYIILWAVIPEATSASEKLEMKGEKVDLNSIKNTIQEDLEGFRTRAEKAGKDFGEKAKAWSQDFSSKTSQAATNFSSELNSGISRNTGRVGSVIGIIFKAFFLFIAGTIAFALLMALLGILIGGASFLPLKDFVVSGFGDNVLVWVAIFGFLVVPVIALITFIVRRTMGLRGKNNYIGAVLSSLWVVGLFAAIMLAISIAKKFKSRNRVEETVTLIQPPNQKLIIKSANDISDVYDNTYLGIHLDDDDVDMNDAPFGVTGDSMYIRNIRIGVVKSVDTLYHVRVVKFSRGNNASNAKEVATNIGFKINQNNSELILPDGFVIHKNDKYRFQQILVVVEVPEGKRIEKDKSINRFHSFSMNGNRRYGYEMNWDDVWENNYQWGDNKEFIMTSTGLKSTSKNNNNDWNNEEEENKKQQLKDLEQQQKDIEEKKKELLNNDADSTKYKYQPEKPQVPSKPVKSTANKTIIFVTENPVLRFSI